MHAFTHTHTAFHQVDSSLSLSLTCAPILAHARRVDDNTNTSTVGPIGIETRAVRTLPPFPSTATPKDTISATSTAHIIPSAVYRKKREDRR